MWNYQKQSSKGFSESRLNVSPDVAAKAGESAYFCKVRPLPNIFASDVKRQGIVERKVFNFKNPLDEKNYVKFIDACFENDMAIPFLQILENYRYAIKDNPQLSDLCKSLNANASSQKNSVSAVYVQEDAITPTQQNTIKITTYDKTSTKETVVRKKANKDVVDFLTGSLFDMSVKNKPNPNSKTGVSTNFDGCRFVKEQAPFWFKVDVDAKHPDGKHTVTKAELEWIAQTSEKISRKELAESALLASPLYALYQEYKNVFEEMMQKDYPQQATEEIVDNIARILSLIFHSHRQELENLISKALSRDYYSIKKKTDAPNENMYSDKTISFIIDKNNLIVNRILYYMNNQQAGVSYQSQQQQQQQAQTAPQPTQPSYNAVSNQAPMFNAGTVASPQPAFTSDMSPEDDLPF